MPWLWLLSGVFGMTGFGVLLTALEMELSSHVLRFPDQVFTVLHKYPDLSLIFFF